MRGTFRLTKIMGIDINIHVTFFLLLGFFFLLFGLRGLALIIGVFFFVTVHELCHSMAAAYFGIKVKRITLLPIGGVASMSSMPTKPHQEFIISLAGPLSNIFIVIAFYYPLRAFLGQETLMYPLLVMLGQAKFSGPFNLLAHVYWINLVLAVFNMIPAFPMDGGRVLRAALSSRIGYEKGTAIAVRLGHIFALLFAYFGIVHGHIFLLVIAVFIYMAASSEGLQVRIEGTIKNYSVKDVLAGNFVSVRCSTSLSKMLELMFHTHQEDYPVIEDGKFQGFVTRRSIMRGLHEKGGDTAASEIMRKDILPVKETTKLHVVQRLMQKHTTGAMPVAKNGRIVGVVTMSDINRVYVLAQDGT
ncbi:MAG: site-2 protease family protein [Candidatus Omnitrophota bacterium]